MSTLKIKERGSNHSKTKLALEEVLKEDKGLLFARVNKSTDLKLKNILHNETIKKKRRVTFVEWLTEQIENADHNKVSK